MDRGLQFDLFCNEFVDLVNSGYDVHFYYIADRAVDNLRKVGQRLSKRFKDEDIILELRHRSVKILGKAGTIHCDGTVEGKRPRTGVGTKVKSCG